MEKHYTINEAARLIGRSKHTLMRWEEQGVFVPKRDSKGWRYYTSDEIEVLEEIKKKKAEIMFSGGKGNKSESEE